MNTTIDSTPSFIEAVYRTMERNLAIIRERLQRPLSFAEKILYGHLASPDTAELVSGRSYIKTNPDRVALQDATAQMAILQFMLADRNEAAVPVTVHCDHLIKAQTGATPDLAQARSDNREVYEFLTSASKRYGFGCWLPGAGIIHQVVLERYAFPGLMLLGTDSHTPNAGGLGSFAVGVGGADAVDVMVGMPWEVLHPKIVAVRLTGQLQGWAAPKDIILKLLGLLTCAGGTNRVFEYIGEGAATLSCTGKATICNMGAELGATTSLFPFDQEMATYLEAAGRGDAAACANRYHHLLTADPEVIADPEAYFDELVDIDLSTLEPQIVGPHSPDRITPVSKMAERIEETGCPSAIRYTLIGSCTNSSYEDMGRIAAMARQIAARGIQLKTPLLLTPGSAQVKATIARDGLLADLEAIGATLLANACGPCIGQWQRDDIKPGDVNTIMTSYNRNFPKRNDGNAETCCFIGSPETALAYALFGTFDQNPFTTPLSTPDGSLFLLEPPEPVDKTPPLGLINSDEGFIAPLDDRHGQEVIVDPDSERLALLEPFAAWEGEDFKDLHLLLKASGKCTTDHISPAGPWLRFRGHLDNISNNLFSGAVNAFTGVAGSGINQITGEEQTFGELARAYQAAQAGWVAVGDENYGEGSSREHAAMCPRHLGCKAVICRSFARIHETNLKKQGVLALTFTSTDDYERIEQDDRIDLIGLNDLAPGSTITAVLHHRDGTSTSVALAHSLNDEQIDWFKAGSALNHLRATESSRR